MREMWEEAFILVVGRQADLTQALLNEVAHLHHLPIGQMALQELRAHILEILPRLVALSP